MKEQLPINPPTQVKVENYQTESTNMPLALMIGMKPTFTADTPTILYFKAIPKELADILEKQVMKAMTNQKDYEQFLISLA